MSSGLAAGIIAAGRGSRLSASHPGLPKPMIPVAGAPLCHWVARALAEAGVERVTLLRNSRGRAVEESLRQAFPRLDWTFLEADTASSWESFRLVAKTLARTEPRFLMSTVDAVFAAGQTGFFADQAAGCAAALALTDFIDDEKPLWADLGEDGRVAALGPAARTRRYATAGLYFLTAAVSESMPSAESFDSLRAYLASLVLGEHAVRGVPLSKAIDVDRPEDVRQAEQFLKESRPW